MFFFLFFLFLLVLLASVLTMSYNNINYIILCISKGMWERYGAAFEKVWAGSAFKGTLIYFLFVIL